MILRYFINESDTEPVFTLGGYVSFIHKDNRLWLYVDGVLYQNKYFKCEHLTLDGNTVTALMNRPAVRC